MNHVADLSKLLDRPMAPGDEDVLVPLGRGRFLNVTAPCAMGIRFAAKALPRMKT